MATDVITVKGADIRAARYAKGLKVFELAELVGISGGYVSAIELGRVQGSPAVLVAIAKALDLDPRTIIVSKPQKRSRA